MNAYHIATAYGMFQAQGWEVAIRNIKMKMA